MMHIGTAGWSLPRSEAASFPGEGSHLERYARVLNCVEINSSFYRRHDRRVYERWAEQTPPGFRFSVKLPRLITHDQRLRRVAIPLDDFLGDVCGLGERLAVLLVQLPPSLVFELRTVRNFFERLSKACSCSIVCEPRHESWFSPAADAALERLEVSRAAADPARWPVAAHPGGWLGPEGDGNGAVVYHRWHGSPRMYWSRYGTEWIEERCQDLMAWPSDTDCWCVFDNTAGGGAVTNGLELRSAWR